LNTSEIGALYIAGLPDDLTVTAVKLWQIREATSFQGTKKKKSNLKKF